MYLAIFTQFSFAHLITPKESMYFIIFKDNGTFSRAFFIIPGQFQDKWHYFQIPGVFQDQGQIQELFKVCVNPGKGLHEVLLMSTYNLCFYGVLTNDILQLSSEPRSEKTGLGGFRPGPTQTGLYNHRRWLET